MALQIQDFADILELQGGGCYFCARKPDEAKLAVDHCHDTGTVRGILCFGCNVSLARLGDNVTGIKKVLDYLERATRP